MARKPKRWEPSQAVISLFTPASQQRKPSKRNRYRERSAYLKRKYGITVEDYDRMLADQGGRCAICSADKPGGRKECQHFHVDHDHVSGRVRALLCNGCNLRVGLFEQKEKLFVTHRYEQYILEHEK